eukprot:g43377.t1
MPHKIGFVTISCSGHEDGYNSNELMVHAPTVNGWRSPRQGGVKKVFSMLAFIAHTFEYRYWDVMLRLCRMLEIVLQMVERCRIRKLQLLAHQYLISTKIEFYISDSLPDHLGPHHVERFRRL